MDARECQELDKRMNELESKFDQILLKINKIIFMCYGGVLFFVLSEIGFLKAIQM